MPILALPAHRCHSCVPAAIFTQRMQYQRLHNQFRKHLASNQRLLSASHGIGRMYFLQQLLDAPLPQSSYLSALIENTGCSFLLRFHPWISWIYSLSRFSQVLVCWLVLIPPQQDLFPLVNLFGAWLYQWMVSSLERVMMVKPQVLSW